jgi:hypothetical protein
MARPQDEGIAEPYVEDENAASGVDGRRGATGIGGLVHFVTWIRPP